MIISLIVAMDVKRGIGMDNQIPWKQSGDMKRFKALTMGHHMILGRKTFESIGKPLPGRVMIVVTRNRNYQPPGVLIAHSMDYAVGLARASGESEVFIMGGGEIYSLAIKIIDRIYMTLIQGDMAVDTFFCEINDDEWEKSVISSHEADAKNMYPYSFLVFKRKKRRVASRQDITLTSN